MYYLIDSEWNVVERCSTYLKSKDYKTITLENATEEEKSAIERFESPDRKFTLISEYKDIQKDIWEIKSELQDIEEVIDSKTDNWKKLLNIRKWVLEKRLAEVREKSDEVALKWVNEFWEEIIWEF